MMHLIVKYDASIVSNHFEMSFKWLFVPSFECKIGTTHLSLEDLTMGFGPLQ